MKKINFTNHDYNNLLKQLGPNSPASMPVEMMLEGQTYPIRLVVHSNAAPKNPEIKFQHQDEHGTWFSITDQTNGNINQVFVEYMRENNHNQILDVDFAQELFPTINNDNFFTKQESITQNFSIINNRGSKTLKHSNSKLIQAVINKYGEYPPHEHPQFQYGEFIIRALGPEYGYEGDRPDNTNDKKINCRLQIKEGMFFNINGKVFSTPGDEENSPSTENLWVLDHKGSFYTCTMKGEISKSAIGNHHSFFNKKDGFGKPIACGGHVEIKEGKITKIDNCSGHYKPSKDQLILAVKYLYKLDVLSEDVKIEYHTGKALETILLNDILLADSNDILSQYPTLEITDISTSVNTDNSLNIEEFVGTEVNYHDSQTSGNTSNLNEFDIE